MSTTTTVAKATRKSPIAAKQCSCCGDLAGRYQQWFNQDTGYGICRKCFDWILNRDGGARESQLEMRKRHGIPGVHYEAKYFTHFGMDFVVMGDFPDTPEGTKEANDFMKEFAGVGVLEVSGGRVILAAEDDKGIEPKKSSRGR